MKTYSEGSVWTLDQARCIYGTLAADGRGGLLSNDGDGRYRNKFVGMWTGPDGELALSLPKIYIPSPGENDFKALISSLRRYFSTFPSLDSAFECGSIISQANKVKLFTKLVEYTELFGWHSEDSWRESGLTEYADWNLTPQISIGVSQHNTLLFPETVGTRANLDPGRLAPIQAAGIIGLAKDIRPLIDIPSHVEQLLEEASCIAEDSHFGLESARAVVSEFADGNRDHDRDLAYLLQLWLNSKHHSRKSEGHLGTISFPHCWWTFALLTLPNFMT